MDQEEKGRDRAVPDEEGGRPYPLPFMTATAIPGYKMHI